jgi:hypothetical protein
VNLPPLCGIVLLTIIAGLPGCSRDLGLELGRGTHEQVPEVSTNPGGTAGAPAGRQTPALWWTSWPLRDRKVIDFLNWDVEAGARRT